MTKEITEIEVQRETGANLCVLCERLLFLLWLFFGREEVIVPDVGDEGVIMNYVSL